MSGHRRAALALHGLQASDQKWFLAQLPEADQRILQAHLQELQALGFAADPALIQDLPVDTPPEPVADQGENRRRLGEEGAQMVERLRHARPERVAAALAGEPVRLIARVLHLANWPWHDALLALLPAATRQRVQAVPVPACANRLDLALLSALLQRLHNLAETAPRTALHPVRRERMSFWRR